MTVRSELLQQSKDRLLAYMNAESTILKGAQSYSIGSRTLTRADLDSIRAEIRRLQKDCLALERGGNIRIQRVVPRCF